MVDQNKFVGRQVLQQMLAEEVTSIVGVKGKHDPDRQASRHGVEQGSVVLGGRKLGLPRPRVRTTDGREVRLETYETFQDEDLLSVMALERMLHGLSVVTKRAWSRWEQTCRPGASARA